MLNKKEILRQLVHFSGVLVFFIPEAWDQVTFGSILLSISIAVYVIAKSLEDLKKKAKKKIVKFAVSGTYKIINLAERKKDFTFRGAVMFFIGVGMTLIIFPRDIAFMSILALAAGDSASTIVGIHLGSHKIWFNKKKSWEGAFASFAAITIFGSLFMFRADIVLVTALVGTMVELYSRKIDDNISIPLMTGIILFSLRALTGFI